MCWRRAVIGRKLRRRLTEMNHDYEQEIHEEELVEFFDQIVVDNKGTRLSKYKKELLEQNGVSRVTELPFLIDEPGFFATLGLNFTEEARLKQSIRQVAKGVEKEGKVLARHLQQVCFNVLARFCVRGRRSAVTSGHVCGLL